MNKDELIDQFIDRARSYIGTPFKHQGRDKNGIDCIGIVIVPLNEIGFFSYNNTNYKRYGLGGEIIEVINKYCIEIPLTDTLEKGDILLFSKNKSQHLAIYTGHSILHAHNFVGKAVEHDLDNNWKSKITKIFRYKEDITL